MSLGVRVPPYERTGVTLVDLALRSLYDCVAAIVSTARKDVVIRAVSLPNATTVTVPHGLGYAYSHVSVSPPTGGSSTGRIQIITPTDASKHVKLQANGWGATIAVDLRVT